MKKTVSGFYLISNYFVISYSFTIVHSYSYNLPKMLVFYLFYFFRGSFPKTRGKSFNFSGLQWHESPAVNAATMITFFNNDYSYPTKSFSFMVWKI